MSEPLYFELHLIVRGANVAELDADAKALGAWTSRLDEDMSEEERPGDVIVTTRVHKRAIPEARIDAVRFALFAKGYTIVRAKIEAVIYDRRFPW